MHVGKIPMLLEKFGIKKYDARASRVDSCLLYRSTLSSERECYIDDISAQRLGTTKAIQRI